MATMKDLRIRVEGALDEKITTREKLLAAVPLLTEFQSAAKLAFKTARRCQELARDLSNACAEYALEHPSVFDNGLHNEDGVQVGDITIDNVVYHLASGYDKPKRIDGENLSQDFLNGLPEAWRKISLEFDTTGINRAHVTLDELEKHGLYRPAKHEWSEKATY